MEGDFHRSRTPKLCSDARYSIDGPPILSPVDRVINLHHGSTTAIEATHERLVASKEYPVPSFEEKIDQLERDGSNLNHEAIYFRKMEPIRKKFKVDISRWARELNDVLSKLDEIEQNVDRERTLLLQSPQLSPVDRIISLYFDSTIDLDTTTKELQGPKQDIVLDPPNKIEQLQRRNGSRTQDVAYLRRREPPMIEFKNKVSSIANKLERALSKLGKAQREVDANGFGEGGIFGSTLHSFGIHLIGIMFVSAKYYIMLLIISIKTIYRHCLTDESYGETSGAKKI